MCDLHPHTDRLARTLECPLTTTDADLISQELATTPKFTMQEDLPQETLNLRTGGNAV